MIRRLLTCSLTLTLMLAFTMACSGTCHSTCPPPPASYSPFPILEWSHAYGGLLDDEGRAVLQAPDGGYVVAGTTNSLSDDGLSRAFLFKTDENGTLRWIKTYGDIGNDTAAYSMVNASDGGYVIAGKSWPEANGSTGPGEDVYLVKTDAGGNLLWQGHYGGAKNDSGQCVVQSDDGGYAILGHTESYGNGGKDAYLVKIDPEGNLLWNKTYGSKKDDIGYYILKTDDDGYLFTGRIMSDATSSQSNHFVYLTKVDSNGTVQWETGYTDPDSTVCYSILNGSGQVLANLNVSGRYHVAFTESNGTKAAGNPFFLFGDFGDTIGYSSIGYGYDGAITAGYTNTGPYIGNGMKDVYLLKNLPSVYLAYGGAQWQQAYGGEKDDIGYSISPTSDGGQIIAGSTESFGSGGKDVYLLKIGYNRTDGHNVGNSLMSHTLKDDPQTTDLALFLSTPVPPAQTSGPKPTPSMAYVAIPIIFIIMALALRNIKS